MNITKTKTNGSPEEKVSTILNPHDTAIYIDVIKRNNFCHTYFGAKSTWLTTCPALTRPENPTARAKHTTAYSRSSHDINPVIIRHPPVPKNAERCQFTQVTGYSNKRLYINQPTILLLLIAMVVKSKFLKCS